MMRIVKVVWRVSHAGLSRSGSDLPNEILDWRECHPLHQTRSSTSDCGQKGRMFGDDMWTSQQSFKRDLFLLVFLLIFFDIIYTPVID